MFITNGKIIFHSLNDDNALEKAIEMVEENHEEQFGEKVKFKKDKKQKFTCFVIPKQVTFEELYAVLTNVEVRATPGDINLDLTEIYIRQYKYFFTDDEKNHFADQIDQAYLKSKDFEVKIAEVKAKYKEEVGDVQNEVKIQVQLIDELINKRTRGHENRNIDCIARLNFKENKKYYIDVTDGKTVIDSEDLKEEEKQLRIFDWNDKDTYEEENFLTGMEDEDIEGENIEVQTKLFEEKQN
jgi:hypothetical protein